MSWLESLLKLTSHVAAAKVLNGTTKIVEISPDGARLYVSGFTGLPGKDQQRNWQFDILPIGLQVIDTATGTELARIENEANDVDISSNGEVIFLRGWTENRSWTDVLDAGSLDMLAHQEGQLLYAAQTLAGESLVVGGPEGQWARILNIFEQKKFIPLSKLSGNGYWISTP